METGELESEPAAETAAEPEPAKKEQIYYSF